jgi:glycosyltransferase involved in cell wall biosynthesis
MGMPSNAFTAQRDSIRLKHGLNSDEIIAASVTTLSHTKRLDVILGALAELRDTHPRLRLLILGAGRISHRAHKLIERYKLHSRIRLTGWLSYEDYSQLLVASDLVIDMRYPSGAETSASLLRALAAGQPAIVSDQGSFAELPDSVAVKIEVGPGEQTRLAAALAELAANPSLRLTMSNAALDYANSTLRLDEAARSYIDTVQEAIQHSVPATSEVWDFGSDLPAFRRTACSSVYKVARAISLCRTYGWADTVRRLKAETYARHSGFSRGTV